MTDEVHDAAEWREYLRLILIDEAQDLTSPIRRSPADVLFVVDELVAAVRLEERRR